MFSLAAGGCLESLLATASTKKASFSFGMSAPAAPLWPPPSPPVCSTMELIMSWRLRPFPTSESSALALTLTCPSSVSANANTGFSGGSSPDLLIMETALEMMCSETLFPALMNTQPSLSSLMPASDLSVSRAFPISLL